MSEKLVWDKNKIALFFTAAICIILVVAILLISLFGDNIKRKNSSMPIVQRKSAFESLSRVDFDSSGKPVVKNYLQYFSNSNIAASSPKILISKEINKKPPDQKISEIPVDYMKYLPAPIK